MISPSRELDGKQEPREHRGRSPGPRSLRARVRARARGVHPQLRRARRDRRVGVHHGRGRDRRRPLGRHRRRPRRVRRGTRTRSRWSASSTKGATASARTCSRTAGSSTCSRRSRSTGPSTRQAGKERHVGVDAVLAPGRQRGDPHEAEPGDVCNWDLMVDLLAEQAPFWEPGRAHGYHAMTIGWLVGEVVRRVSGKSLGTFFRGGDRGAARPRVLDRPARGARAEGGTEHPSGGRVPPR